MKKYALAWITPLEVFTAAMRSDHAQYAKLAKEVGATVD